MLLCRSPRVCWRCAGSPDVAPPRAGVCARRCAHACRRQLLSIRRPCDTRGQSGTGVAVPGAGYPGAGEAAACPGASASACAARAHASASAPSHPDAVRTAGGRGRHGGVRPGAGAAARRLPALPRAAREAGRARVPPPHGRAAREGSAAVCGTTSTGMGARQAGPAPAARAEHPRRCPRRDVAQLRRTAGVWPVIGTATGLPGSKGIRRLTAPRPHRLPGRVLTTPRCRERHGGRWG